MHAQDYKPTPYLAKHVDLCFQLGEDVTHVKSRLSMVPTYEKNGASAPSLVLDGAGRCHVVVHRDLACKTPADAACLSWLHRQERHEAHERQGGRQGAGSI